MATEYIRWIDDTSAFVVRLDVRMYKVYAHHFRVPFDPRVAAALILTAKDCLLNFRDSCAVDEINIVFSNRKSREKETVTAMSKLKNENYYDLKYARGDVEAIDLVSYASSFASHKFNIHLKQQAFDEIVEPKPLAAANSGRFSFHGSVISLSSEETLTCVEVSKRSFIRAHDANAILPLVSSKTAHAQLSEMLKTLREEQELDWSTSNAFFRRGILLKRNLAAPVWSFMDIFDDDVGSESQLQFLLILDSKLYLSHFKTRFKPFTDNLEQQVGEDTLLAGAKIQIAQSNKVSEQPQNNDHDKHIRFTKRTIEESPADSKRAKKPKKRNRPSKPTVAKDLPPLSARAAINLMNRIKDMSVEKLKQELSARGVDFSDCIEKSELVSRVANLYPSLASATATKTATTSTTTTSTTTSATTKTTSTTAVTPAISTSGINEASPLNSTSKLPPANLFPSLPKIVSFSSHPPKTSPPINMTSPHFSPPPSPVMSPVSSPKTTYTYFESNPLFSAKKGKEKQHLSTSNQEQTTNATSIVRNRMKPKSKKDPKTQYTKTAQTVIGTDETCDVDMLDFDSCSPVLNTTKTTATLFCNENLSVSSAKSEKEAYRSWKLADLDEFLSDSETLAVEEKERDVESEDFLVPDSQPINKEHNNRVYDITDSDGESTQEARVSSPSDAYSPPFPFTLPPRPASLSSPRISPPFLNSRPPSPFRNGTTEEVELKRKNSRKKPK